ncbi:hypothetical protein PTKIN_Ptkin03bG0222200 [Pterospermum kingtungense]
MTLTNVIFELDAQSVVDAIHGPGEDITEFGLLIKECSSVLSEGLFSFQLARRQVNRVAHCLARVSRFNASHTFCFEAPRCICDCEMLAEDCAGISIS